VYRLLKLTLILKGQQPPPQDFALPNYISIFGHIIQAESDYLKAYDARDLSSRIVIQSDVQGN